ncbi:AP-1 complex subunit mu-1 [Chelonia mydas]|uniref:AP-1 complex subunit mu-1 n=1 Tax=Chelonia mydas TaxID=8469 RepID=M7B6Z4_CHEMY|nr:AP-1 complex subunit mu-1 [Chelonia mydas]
MSFGQRGGSDKQHEDNESHGSQYVTMSKPNDFNAGTALHWKKKAAAKDKSKILEQIVSSKKQEEEKKRTLDKRTPAQLAYEKMQEKRQMERILKKASKTHKQRVERLRAGPELCCFLRRRSGVRAEAEAAAAPFPAGSEIWRGSWGRRAGRRRAPGGAMSASAVYVLDLKGKVFSEYFKELEEESIRDNFVIIYELLDELMDFGYPQTTDSKILQEYITQEGHKLETGAPRPPATVTNAVSWRSEGIKYRKNEVFLDVIESVNLLRLGLNDKVLFDNTGRGKSKSVELEDVKFHQCVRLSRFENDRTISFIPPDGEFELMSYRLNTHVKPLIWIESVIEKHSHSRIEYMIKAKSQFKRRSTANNVEIHIPVPNDADSPKFKTTVGSVKWVPENSEIVWSIKSFPGGKEYLMRAHFGLPSVEAEDKEGKPPISVKFEIPYFTTSGIQVRYLKIIEKSGYQALPWVRYITQNGDYQLRTQ